MADRVSPARVSRPREPALRSQASAHPRRIPSGESASVGLSIARSIIPVSQWRWRDRRLSMDRRLRNTVSGMNALVERYLCLQKTWGPLNPRQNPLPTQIRSQIEIYSPCCLKLLLSIVATCGSSRTTCGIINVVAPYMYLLPVEA